VPVLIQGETGTGKELIAQAIHYGLSGTDKEKGNFVAINCAAITPSLFESELFGYEAGAFTGSLARGQLGKLDLARNGTIFFDEISELSLELQGKLLRVLQEKEYYRVGGLKKVKFSARVICATNVDLAERVEKGLFRRDLFYRLNVAHISLPPLRERREEIIPLAYFFLHKYCALKGKNISEIEGSAQELLRNYEWPGNVRELQNVINHLTTRFDTQKVTRQQILELYPVIATGKGKHNLSSQEKGEGAKVKPLKDHIEELILYALKKNGGNKSLTAAELGISRHVLYNYLQKMGRK